MPVTATLLHYADQFEIHPQPYTRNFDIGSTVEGDIIVAFLAGGGDITLAGATVVGETGTVVSAGGGSRALYAAYAEVDGSLSGTQSVVFDCVHDWGGVIAIYKVSGASLPLVDTVNLYDDGPYNEALDVVEDGLTLAGLTSYAGSSNLVGFTAQLQTWLALATGYRSESTTGNNNVASNQGGSDVALIALSFAPAGGGGEEYNEDIDLGVEVAQSNGGNRVLAAALSLGAQLAVQNASQAELGSAISLGATGGLIAASQATMSSSIALGAASALVPVASVVFDEAVTLAAETGLSTGGQRQLVGAIALGLAVAQSATNTVTYSEALTLAALAGYGPASTLTANDVAAFVVDASLASAGTIGDRTFNEEIALGVATLIETASQHELAAGISLGIEAGNILSTQAVQGVSIELAAEVAQAVTTGSLILESIDLSVAADMDVDSQLTVTGSISLGAEVDQSLATLAVFNPGVTFEAVFDQEAASQLTAEEAVALAVQAVMQSNFITGNEIVSTVPLTGQMTRTTRLRGTMKLTARLKGRLN